MRAWAARSAKRFPFQGTSGATLVWSLSHPVWLPRAAAFKLVPSGPCHLVPFCSLSVTKSGPTAVDSLSTVDVADLSSGVTTVVLAGKERLLGRPSQHYGALTRADAPLPELPVR